MTPESDVPSVMDGIPGKYRFEILPTTDDPDSPKDLGFEIWKLKKDSNLKEIFGVDNEKLKGLVISKKKIKEIYKILIEGNYVLDYSMIFIFSYHGRPRVLEARRTTGPKPRFWEYPLINKDWILSSQYYVLIVPKLI